MASRNSTTASPMRRSTRIRESTTSSSTSSNRKGDEAGLSEERTTKQKKVSKDDTPSSKDFSSAVVNENESKQLSRVIDFPLVGYAPFKVKYDEYVQEYEDDMIRAHGDVMNILFGFPKEQNPPPDNKRPVNYKAMVLERTKVHYKTIPDMEVMFVRKFPCKSESDLGYKVSYEKNLVLFGWCQRLSLLGKKTMKVFRKKQAEANGNVEAHCYLIARYRQHNTRLVVVTGKDVDDCPLKLLPNKEASKVDAYSDETLQPEVSEEGIEVDTSPEETSVPEVSPASPSDANQGGEEPTVEEGSSDDDESMESEEEEVSEEVSVIIICIHI